MQKLSTTEKWGIVEEKEEDFNIDCREIAEKIYDSYRSREIGRKTALRKLNQLEVAVEKSKLPTNEAWECKDYIDKIREDIKTEQYTEEE